jgi:hypothetical protein
MLVVRAGTEGDPHWNDTARELLRVVCVVRLRPSPRFFANWERRSEYAGAVSG